MNKSCVLFIVIVLTFSSTAFSQIDSILNFSNYTVLISKRFDPYVTRNRDTVNFPYERLFGTGFFIYDDILNTNSVYLVTNRHLVYDDFRSKYTTQITLNFVIRTKLFDEGYSLLSSPLLLIKKKDSTRIEYKDTYLIDTSNYEPLWKLDNSRGFSDVVLINTDHLESLKEREVDYRYKCFNISNSLYFDEIKEGDTVFSYGYPIEIADTVNDNLIFNFPTDYKPIYRQGLVISKNKEHKLIIGEKTYLVNRILKVDMIVYPGQSGSPVFIMRNSRIYLAGIISASTLDNSKGMIFPVDYLIDVLKIF